MGNGVPPAQGLPRSSFEGLGAKPDMLARCNDAKGMKGRSSYGDSEAAGREGNEAPDSKQEAFNAKGAPTKAGFARGGQKLPRAAQPGADLKGQMNIGRGTGGGANKPLKSIKGMRGASNRD